MPEALTAEEAANFSESSLDGVIIPSSHLSWRDLVSEAVIALTARPARTILTALGTVLGVAALVATLGLAKTAGS